MFVDEKLHADRESKRHNLEIKMKPEQINPSKKEILFKNHANISVSMLIFPVYKLEAGKKKQIS